MKLFGMRSLQTLVGISILALSVGCNREPDTHTVSGDVKTRIPFAAEGGAYQLQEVSLQGITSLYEFSGQFATFYIYPSVSDNKLHGQQPKTRFLKAGDVYVPEDTLSQQLTVIYAHLQRLAALDSELGAEGVNTWPRDVGIAVRYKDDNGYATNNAFYDGSTDAMLVVPYTQDNLPIAVNAGILAHEHFHSLYYKLVEKQVFNTQMPLHGKGLREQVLGKSIVEDFDISKVTPENGDEATTVYHRIFSRGINEGLADFWAWIYTGDPDFLTASLPTEQETRTLNMNEKSADGYVFPNAKNFQMEVINRFTASKDCRNDRVAYCLGTKYARLLKYFSGVVQRSRQISSQEARKIVGAGIVSTLPRLKEALLKLKEGEYYEPSNFFELLANGIPDIQDEEKKVLTDLVKNSQEKPVDKSKLARSSGPEVTVKKLARNR